jgi:hypothetical protein
VGISPQNDLRSPTWNTSWSLASAELVSHVAHALKHHERVKEFRHELALALDVKGGHWPVQEAKPDPLPWCELQFSVCVIILILVLMLSLFKAFSDLEQELIPVE